VAKGKVAKVKVKPTTTSGAALYSPGVGDAASAGVVVWTIGTLKYPDEARPRPTGGGTLSGATLNGATVELKIEVSASTSGSGGTLLHTTAASTEVAGDSTLAPSVTASFCIAGGTVSGLSIRYFKCLTKDTKRGVGGDARTYATAKPFAKWVKYSVTSGEYICALGDATGDVDSSTGAGGLVEGGPQEAVATPLHTSEQHRSEQLVEHTHNSQHVV
jgi:hypothetical protein